LERDRDGAAIQYWGWMTTSLAGWLADEQERRGAVFDMEHLCQLCEVCNLDGESLPALQVVEGVKYDDSYLLCSAIVSHLRLTTTYPLLSFLNGNIGT
jgi:hypothetical protein